MAVRVVVDTNVLISALLVPGSVPALALAAIWETGTIIVYDARILAEYRDVTGRPKFAAIPRERVDALHEALLARGERLEDVAAWLGEMGDESDRAFVEVALDGHADAIVTGNGKDFPTGLAFAVTKPAELLAQLT